MLWHVGATKISCTAWGNWTSRAKSFQTKKKTAYVFLAVREALFARSALPHVAALRVCFCELVMLWCLPALETLARCAASINNSVLWTAVFYTHWEAGPFFGDVYGHIKVSNLLKMFCSAIAHPSASRLQACTPEPYFWFILELQITWMCKSILSSWPILGAKALLIAYPFLSYDLIGVSFF